MALCLGILSWRPAEPDLEEEGVDDGSSRRYRPRRAALGCPQDRSRHSAREAPLQWMFHVTWSMRPGKRNPGQEGRLGKIRLLCGSAWGRVAVPGEPDLIYVELLIKPEAPRLGRSWYPGLA